MLHYRLRNGVEKGKVIHYTNKIIPYSSYSNPARHKMPYPYPSIILSKILFARYDRSNVPPLVQLYRHPIFQMPKRVEF